MLRFFEPSEKWLDWLAKYAAGRVVFDVGCGAGHVTLSLLKRKVKVLGIDPRYKWGLGELTPELSKVVLPYEAQHVKALRNTPNTLVMFCRPCHSGFVQETIDVLHPTAEVLYISKVCNVGVDLVDMSTRVLDCPKCPEEKVYQVRRGA
jgi:SAM-dependent methyltransferase